MLSYDLYCLDFDGLLVNTEPLQFASYQKALKPYGISLNIDFSTYLDKALSKSGDLLKEFVLEINPHLEWEKVRKEKNELYSEALKTMSPPLMESAYEFINLLLKQGAPLCVVTNSPRIQIEKIRQAHPILQKIDSWFTKEMYPRAKPHPDGYLLALDHFKVSPSKALGFEDSLKGLEALKRAQIHPFFISPSASLRKEAPPDVPTFSSLTELLNELS